MKRKIALVIVAFIFTVLNINAQDLNAPINKDPNVKIGKLDNGMTYYLRENKKPEKRIEFQIAINVGSVLEEEKEQGLAHFTEHMGFNGIVDYPHNEMVSELQKIGVAFGHNLNAYTSLDETIYMVQMPSDDEKYVKMGLDILYGWANGMLFDDEEINSERGVITEEYRMGQGAEDRMMKKWLPVLFANSQYAKRLPIGTLEVIQGFENQTIKDFYKKWYRPDLQAIIIVGDFDMKKMEEMVKEKFGKIAMPKDPQTRTEYQVPAHKEPLVSVSSDVEAMGSSIMLVRKFPYAPMKTVGDYKMKMTRELYNIMLNSRLNEMMQNPQTPFLSAYAGYIDFWGVTEAFMSQVSAKENKILESLEIMMNENYRVLQHGFLETELQRAKEELMSQYETRANEVDKTESSQFASQYVDNYLNGDPIPGAKREYSNYAKKYLHTITLDEVNALAKEFVTLENLVAVVTAPDKEGITIPSETQVMAVLKDESLKNVEAYVDTYKDQELIDLKNLVPGTITNRKDLGNIGTTELTLSNGIKVALKKTDFKNDEILFIAKSKGGYSLYDVKDLPSAIFAPTLVDRAGIGELDMASLTKKMKGKKVGLMPSIDGTEEFFYGSSTPKDLEFFMQYLNAFFTVPRNDSTVYDIVKEELNNQVKMIMANPMYRFIFAFQDEMVENDPYQKLPYSEEIINGMNYNRAFEIFKERFANPADFDFTFVGNFDQNVMEEYLKTYIASLKTTSDKENFNKDAFAKIKKKHVEKTLYAGVDENASAWVGLGFSGKYPWTPENNMILHQIGDALDIELIETIREKMGGIYSPMTDLSITKYPESEYAMMVLFACDSKNTEKLSDASMQILIDFVNKGPKPETLEKVKEQMIRKYETDFQTNNYWMSYISSKYYYEEEVNQQFDYETMINKITNQDIVNFMKQYFDVKNYLKVFQYPEAMKK